MRGALNTAVWALVICTVCGRNSGPSDDAPVRVPAEQLAMRVGDAPISYLKREDADRRPDVTFLLYARKIVPPITPEQLAYFVSESPCAYVVADADSSSDEIMSKAGFTWVNDYPDGRSLKRRLWEYDTRTEHERDSSSWTAHSGQGISR